MSRKKRTPKDMSKLMDELTKKRSEVMSYFLNPDETPKNGGAREMKSVPEALDRVISKLAREIKESAPAPQESIASSFPSLFSRRTDDAAADKGEQQHNPVGNKC